jgi:archaellum biogenesis protein FlaJ (TadC family)
MLTKGVYYGLQITTLFLFPVLVVATIIANYENLNMLFWSILLVFVLFNSIYQLWYISVKDLIEYDGTILVEEDLEEDRVMFSLMLDGDPLELKNQESASFRVRREETR